MKECDGKEILYSSDLFTMKKLGEKCLSPKLLLFSRFSCVRLCATLWTVAC